jgi:hypothetical protein
MPSLSYKFPCLLSHPVSPGRALFFSSWFEFDSFLFPSFLSNALSLTASDLEEPIIANDIVRCSSTRTRKSPIDRELLPSGRSQHEHDGLDSFSLDARLPRLLHGSGLTAETRRMNDGKLAGQGLSLVEFALEATYSVELCGTFNDVEDTRITWHLKN